MHCVFAANGTWGDVGPLAELAVRVAASGVRVTFVSTPFFAEGLAARGLDVRSAGPFWDPVAALADPRLRHPVLAPVARSLPSAGALPERCDFEREVRRALEGVYGPDSPRTDARTLARCWVWILISDSGWPFPCCPQPHRSWRAGGGRGGPREAPS